ncbi:MAG: hypothetical protein H0Z29_00815 [Candidatus Marinimicrobia bacterium]|nr:hypothetical protein [Candidatus Neomarinimicrobiota bacterium]
MKIDKVTIDNLEKLYLTIGVNNIPGIIVYAPNTYHYTLLNLNNLEKYFFKLHEENNLQVAEISEDVFGISPVINYHKNPGPARKIADRIMKLADKLKIHIISIGTGADIYSLMQLSGGYYDVPKEKKDKVMQIFKNLIDIAEYMGILNINGHRVATIFPERFKSIKISQLSDELGFDVKLGGIDPDTEITGAEAKNLELAITLQNYSPHVSSTVELMYQAGMEPCTIGQMNRFLRIMQANSSKNVVAHMDTGHVIPYGKDKKQEDYNLLSYANITFPRWTVHFNALYKNEHRMPTYENVKKDLDSIKEKPDPVLSPHPEMYCDVYEWLGRVVRNCRVIQVSPEPKPNNLKKLSKEVGECWDILKEKFSDTHIPYPDIEGILIPKSFYEDNRRSNERKQPQ